MDLAWRLLEAWGEGREGKQRGKEKEDAADMNGHKEGKEEEEEGSGGALSYRCKGGAGRER